MNGTTYWEKMDCFSARSFAVGDLLRINITQKVYHGIWRVYSVWGDGPNEGLISVEQLDEFGVRTGRTIPFMNPRCCSPEEKT
jgi:hypothetical protein